MAFKLVIECTKDIEELSINFSDGTVVSKGKIDASPQVQKTSTESVLDTDADYSHISQEKVTPPEITVEDKPPKVANELQNLDI